MNKPKWLPRVLRGLRKAFFTIATIIIILFMLTIVVGYLRPPVTPIIYTKELRDKIEQRLAEREAAEASQLADIALNRSEE